MYVLLFLLTFFVSYADVYIPDGDIPFANNYSSSTVKIMISGVPMIDASHAHNTSFPGFYPIGTFVDVHCLYDSTLFFDKYAIVASHYGEGRVVLSAVHPEISLAGQKAHNIFAEMILWLADIAVT